jgi:hypothetical protein
MSRETFHGSGIRPRKIWLGIALACVGIASLMLALSGCGNSSSPGSTVVEGTTSISAVGESGPGLLPFAGTQYVISVSQGKLDPTKLDVPEGAGVLFINAEDDNTSQHEFVADEGSFDTGVLDPGGQYYVVFTGAGIVSFHDTMNPDITGEIVIAAGETPYGDALPVAGPIISIANNALSSATTRVNAGEPVTFYNAEDDNTVDHHIVADDGSFDTGVLSPGESYSVTFESNGSYRFHDALDSAVKGTITVQ